MGIAGRGAVDLHTASAAPGALTWSKKA
jgi:hypothetical protein